MRTRFSSNLIFECFTILKRRNLRRSKQLVKPEHRTIVEILVANMADIRTMSELLQAPTEGYGDAIVIPAILAENFELKVGLHSLTTNLKNNITNFQQKIDETFSEARDRFKDVLRKCPHHGFLKLHQIDTFYNALTQSDQDSLNAASDGNILNRTPRDALTIIENKSKVRTSRNESVVSKVSTTTFSSSPSLDITALTDIIALTDIVKELVLMNKANQQAHGDLQSRRQSPSGSGSQPSNTIANPRGDVKAITTRSGVSYEGPTIPPTSFSLSKEVKRETEVTKGKVQTTSSESTAHVQPPVVQVLILEPDVAPKPNPKPSIPYPSRLNDQKLQEKTNSQMLKFLQIFQRLHFDLRFADALLYIPKFASMFKSPLSNKEKLFELANTPLTENCSTVLLRKLPEKLRDLGRFLIPCDFQGLESCMALADLGANINLMPLSVWKKLSLSDLTPTHMTLELATRSFVYPAGIAEDVFVQVGKFTFLANFVVVDYDVDPRVPFILGRPFLRTARALVDHENKSINMINFIDITCDDRFPKVLKFKKSNHPSSGSTTTLSDFFPSLTPFKTSDSLFEEFADELALLDPFPPRKEDNNFDFEADLREIEYLLNQDPSTKSNIETINPILEKFTDEPALHYLPPPRDDDDDLFDLKSDNDEWKKLLYGDCYKDIDSKKDNNKDSKMKLIIVEDHIVESNDVLPQLLENNSTFLEESSESSDIATLSSSPFKNKDKVFNPDILILDGN
uniref:Reverse transcriptase domain-containing protein n=1 Tax=Tanacetum cinerariifolium TaxID=118510 RepID=A0A699H708_TANCI|nr:reverse transcriptase domain-containing protein [Tanacetum cinerariifolium]